MVFCRSSEASNGTRGSRSLIDQMLTRRLPRSPALLSALGLFGFTAMLGLSSACVTVNEDEAGGDTADETGNDDSSNDTNDDSNNDTNDDSSNDDSSNDDSSNDTSDDSSDTCDHACAVLASCGIPTDECMSFCVSGPCAECLASSEQCGQDCADACTGGDDGPPGDGDGDSDVPDKECVINDDCGIASECVSCELNDSEGWCEISEECEFDEDCGFGGKCGYNVETADYRCLPAEYCQ